tara:strand:+ start:4736 stop:5977 length:1242 start_codon:yes stop_codon:yes gene_type:complete
MKAKQFNHKSALGEAIVANKHLNHLEDTVISQGKAGATAAIQYLKGLYNLLKGSSEDAVKVSTKWDGAPAIVCGVNPDNNKFFVATKSAFAQNPKLCYTKRDIRKYYGEQPELGKKLLRCLTNLSKLGITNIIQGDYMFDNESVELTDIEGEEYVTFTPNTITYAVPTNTELAQRIQAANMGIVFHTSYEGPSFASMKASYGVDVSAYKNASNVWVEDATYKNFSGTATMTKEETLNFKLTIKTVVDAYKRVPQKLFGAIETQKDFASIFEIYINSEVKKGKLGGTPQTMLDGFLQFYRTRKQAEADKAKTERGKAPRLQDIDRTTQFIEQNKAGLMELLNFFNLLIKAKTFILSQLAQLQNIPTFIKTDNGYKVTEPEGFVAVDKIGNAVKLVDRLTFSKQNFTAQKSWSQD